MRPKNNKKLKIAICVNGRAHEGGMTTVINTTAKALREQGHNVDVITIFGVSQYRKVKSKLFKRTDKILRNKPFLTFITYILSKLTLSFYIYLNYILKRYTAILAMDMSIVNVSYLLKKYFKIPILYFPLGATGELIDQGKIKKNSWTHRYIQKEGKKALEKSTINICSSFHLKHAEQLTTKPAPFNFLHCAPIDPNLFYKADDQKKERNRKKIGIEKNKFVLIYVGRLAARKGPAYLLHAFKKIIKKDKNNNFLLFYIGTGPEEKILKDEIKKINAGNKIKLVGAVTHNKIADYLKAADCFIFTSFIKDEVHEPFSNSVIEAMACGLPIIGFDTVDPSSIYNNKRVLRNNDNSILVPPKNVDALTEAIEKIYINSLLHKRLSDGALREIKKGGYYASNFAKQIEKLILKLSNLK